MKFAVQFSIFLPSISDTRSKVSNHLRFDTHIKRKSIVVGWLESHALPYCIEVLFRSHCFFVGPHRKMCGIYTHIHILLIIYLVIGKNERIMPRSIVSKSQQNQYYFMKVGHSLTMDCSNNYSPMTDRDQLNGKLNLDVLYRIFESMRLKFLSLRDHLLSKLVVNILWGSDTIWLSRRKWSTLLTFWGGLSDHKKPAKGLPWVINEFIWVSKLTSDMQNKQKTVDERTKCR